jgi:3-hydroxybutyryl-CoA dehydrogenase
MKFKMVGIIGAGVMGRGVAQNIAQCGLNAVLVDIDDRVLECAKKEIFNNLRFARMMGQSPAQEDPESTVSRIIATTDYADLSSVDFVVENVTEKWELKKTVYKELDKIVPEDSIFAVNTSAISITRVGSATQRPDRVIGMHFMNPVPMKKMVEVIRGHHTSLETIERAKSFLHQIGKDCVIVNDMPGFVSNRVLMLTVNEAAFLLQDGVAEPKDVDKIFKECFGHKMGPLETMDLIGVDTILYSLEALYEAYNDPKFRPCPLLRKMTDAGLHGRKTGQGFFKYPTQTLE